MPEKVSVVTLGCEKNLVDSEIMSGLVHQGINDMMPRLLSTARHTAYVKIAEGCCQYNAPEVDGEVFVTGCCSEIRDICRVRITHAYEYDLSGEGIA
jgi:hypothetical protein